MLLDLFLFICYFLRSLIIFLTGLSLFIWLEDERNIFIKIDFLYFCSMLISSYLYNAPILNRLPTASKWNTSFNYFCIKFN